MLGCCFFFAQIVSLQFVFGNVRKLNRIKEKVFIIFCTLLVSVSKALYSSVLEGEEDKETSSTGKVSKISIIMYIAFFVPALYITVAKWNVLPERVLSIAVETCSSPCLAPLAQSSTYLLLPRGAS